MAVNCYEASCENNPLKSSCSSNSSKGGTIQPCRLVKINFATDDAITGLTVKRTKVKKNKDSKSPYLAGDKVQLLTRITEKRLIQKKGADMMSSFPAAVNLYKASSDEFKSLKRINKKVKKSVLTLPNEPAPVPKACTVSDMNDSEYFERNFETRKKKRLPVQTNKKSRSRQHKDFEFYDRDAHYCSEMNIDLDCSSTDLLKPYEAGNRVSKKANLSCKDRAGDEVNAHDVWAVLRNINRFQFRPSPPMSDDSTIRSHMKKKAIPKKRFKRRDARIIETCRTEEFAYISRFDLESKSPSFSQSSSFDRITVIDQQNDEFSKMCKQLNKNFSKSRKAIKDNVPSRQMKNIIQNKVSPKTNSKAIKMKDNNNKWLHPEPNEQLLKKATANVEKHGDCILKCEGQYKQPSTSSFDMHCMEPRIDCVQKISFDRVNDDRKRNGKKSSVKSPVVHRYEDMSDNFVYSGNSGTSKEGNGDIGSRKDAKDIDQCIEVFDQIINYDKYKEAVISKGPEIVNKKQIAPIHKRSRLVTSPPAILPKLTQTDIKRRLATLKFPIVVLGREQVSSGVPVMVCESPQFDGLDKHIWPFMIDWQPRCRKADIDKTDVRVISANIQKKKLNTCSTETENMRKNMNELFTSSKKIGLHDRKQVFHTDAFINQRIEQKKPMQVLDNKNVLPEKKHKAIRILKDKVIRMLYKKSSSQNVLNEKYPDSWQNEIKTVKAPKDSKVKVDACTETFVHCNTFAKDNLNPLFCYNNANISNNKALAIKHPWSKGKSASDFIENVIKKIMNGVYYTHDFKHHKDSREASIQTSISFKSDFNYIASQQFDLLTPPICSDPVCTLPGFDNTMPDLEIKTLNLSQIAVKHCVTNIMLQFDVKVPPEQANAKLNVKSTPSLIPLDVIDSQTKIFKCKTTIVNSMLPAELCSLLPKMLHSIMNTEIKLALPPLNKTESHLSTITEITLCENLEVCSQLVLVSSEIQNLLRGVFSNAMKKPSAIVNRSKWTYNNCSLVEDLLPKLSKNLILKYETNMPIVVFAKPSIKGSAKRLEMESPPCNVACKALVPYIGAVTIPQHFRTQLVTREIVNTFNTALNIKATCNIPLFIKPVQIWCYNDHIKVNLGITNGQGFITEVSLSVKDLKIGTLYDRFPKSGFENEIKAIPGCSNNCSEKSETHDLKGLNANKRLHLSKIHSNGGKVRRKGFVKLYRKFKSTTSIVCEKPTALSKIANLDDFLQVIGTSKQLFSVFDDCAAKKILSSIIEMKSWISDINARQAFLVLLLLNKKDTPNLTRFRPILLQGIAVNRITRSQELDMEIEVIERENIKFSQYEGISYLTASRENQDSLLEELYWIAKTTASDYQRPFDETSERLLKSLLEKRKMLNPSYLRVMARYVGLGLLKSPKKN